MSDIKDVLLKDCDNNESGLLGYAYVAPVSAFDSIANTYADDATGFSESVAYAVDDLVMYGCEVYKCTTAHAAGAWNAGNFTLVENGAVRINGTHVLKSDHTWTQLDLNEEESTSGFESLGKKYNRSGKNTASLIHPGTAIATSDFALKCKKKRQWVVMLPMASGKMEQVGSRNSFAEIVASKTTGTRENPDSKWTFEASAYAKSVIYYEATITP